MDEFGYVLDLYFFLYEVWADSFDHFFIIGQVDFPKSIFTIILCPLQGLDAIFDMRTIECLEGDAHDSMADHFYQEQPFLGSIIHAAVSAFAIFPVKIAPT